MYFKQFYLGCLAHASYLIGSDGEAAVVDPQRDVDEYITEAEDHGFKIKYIIETHLHADFVSGHQELAARTGASIVFGAQANAAFAHNPGGRRSGPASWHVYPEQAAAGLWTTPSDLARIAIEMQRAFKGPKGTVLTQASARELLTPTGVGGYAVGYGVAQRGQGWYFSHSGGNWGFACNLVAHYRKGYGFVIMTNSDAGGAIMSEIEGRVAAAYGWDTLDKPIPR